MNLEKEILKFTCKIYSDETLSRSHVQSFIEHVSDFIENVYNPSLQKTIESALHKVVTDKVSEKIKDIFESFKKPFENYDSEDKRLRIYSNYGLYVEPKLCELDTKNNSKSDGVIVSSEEKKVSVLVFDLKHSLQQFFE